MNEEQAKVYPEQETPARPTYEAVIRGIPVGGWLYYGEAVQPNRLTIIVTVEGNRITAEEFCYENEQERKLSRLKAKNLWRQVVLAVLAGV